MNHSPDRARMPRLFATLAVAVLSTGLAAAAARGHAADSFTLTEHFGVAHPEQIITLDLAAPIDPAKTSVTMAIGDAAAVPVPFQLLANRKRLAVRTSLAAGETRTFAVKPGSPAPAAPDAVTVRETDAWYEIANGLTGIRVPKPVQALPFPAPVQGVLLRDGTWTAAGATLALTPPEKAEPKMQVTFLERGPLKTVVVLRYDLGTAFSKTTIALEAGQPSVMFEEEADLDRSYAIELYDAVHPTHARYRGHHSSSKDGGYEPDGQVYRMSHARPALDAQVDLTFAGPRDYGRVARWDPWITDCGWYWQMFDDKAGPEGNLVGAFAGKASRQVGSGMSGVGGYTAPAGMSDLVTAMAADGTIHAVYTGNGGLWHVAIDPSLAAGKPAKIADKLVHPSAVVLKDGTVSVIAFDRQSKGFVEVRGTAGGGFTSAPIEFEGSIAIADPHPCQTIRGDDQFLFVTAKGSSGTEGLLFARSKGQGRFRVFGSVGEIDSGRQIYRPSLVAPRDGSLRLVATNKGGYSQIAFVPPKRPELSKLANPPLGMALNFGSVFEAATGAGAIVEIGRAHV